MKDPLQPHLLLIALLGLGIAVHWLPPDEAGTIRRWAQSGLEPGTKAVHWAEDRFADLTRRMGDWVPPTRVTQHESLAEQETLR